jgi:hypothetical protein
MACCFGLLFWPAVLACVLARCFGLRYGLLFMKKPSHTLTQSGRIAVGNPR